MPQDTLTRCVYLNETGTQRVEMRHPWIFKGHVKRTSQNLSPGEVVPVVDVAGRCVAWGFWSPGNLCLRLLSFGRSKPNVASLLEERLNQALVLRRVWCKHEQTFRLVHGEADQLPGMIVDIYGKVASVQLLTAGWYRHKELISSKLATLLSLDAIILRNDVKILSMEGLPNEIGSLYGQLPQEKIILEIDSLLEYVDPLHGQKTGTYLDVRHFPRELDPLWEGCRVLDCFSYQGRFALRALKGGANRVVAIEQSDLAIAIAQKSRELNKLPEKIEWMCGNAFDLLRKLDERKDRFDVIIMDPPPFSPGKQQVEAARRGYKELAVRAFHLLDKGGALLFLSCSHAFGRDLLLGTLREASNDTKRSLKILQEFHQPPDHPASLQIPESDYLKGFLLHLGSGPFK